jgi:hypothetical protein
MRRAGTGFVTGLATGIRRQPGVRRLMRLPAVFSLNDLSLGEGLTPEAARVTISRWHCAGMAAPAGPRSGLWYNLVVDRRGADVNLGAVLRRQFGSPVMIGAAVLHDAGWVTQVPHAATVAVPLARCYPQITGATLYGRPPVWYATVATAWRAARRWYDGLPSLPPEFALADALGHRDSLHHLRPDDIEIPYGTPYGTLMGALRAMHVPPDIFWPYLEASGIRQPPSRQMRGR